MKNIIILILIFGLSLSTIHAQEKVNFAKIKTETIDGKLYYMYKNEKFNGVITKEMKNENPSYFMEFEVKDGRMNGKAVTVYSDGYVQKENFVDNLLEGPVETYYPNGNIESRVNYSANSIKNGPFEIYYNNGNLMEKGSYELDYLNGIILRYYENGKLMSKTNYSFGRVDGLNEEYDLSGNLKPKAKIGMGTMIDPRDNQTYKTFTFQDDNGVLRTWMAQNLNYNTASSFSYEANKKFKKIFPDIKYAGRGYTWADAMEACPDGWHIPSDEGWEALITHLGGNTAAGTAVKSVNYWHKDANGTNSIGFNALPVGGFWANGKHTGKFGKNVHYWASESTGSYTALGYLLRSDYSDLMRFTQFYKVQPAPCRCEKDYSN